MAVLSQNKIYIDLQLNPFNCMKKTLFYLGTSIICIRGFFRGYQVFYPSYGIEGLFFLQISQKQFFRDTLFLFLILGDVYNRALYFLRTKFIKGEGWPDFLLPSSSRNNVIILTHGVLLFFFSFS